MSSITLSQSEGGVDGPLARGIRKKKKHTLLRLESRLLPPLPHHAPCSFCLLRSSARSRRRILRVRRDVWSPELLRFCRCACLTAPELDNLEAGAKQQAATRPLGSSPAGLMGGTRSGLCSASEESSTAHGTGCFQRRSTEATRLDGKGEDGKARCLVAGTAAFYGNGPPTRGSPQVEEKQSSATPDGRRRRQRDGRDAGAERAISKADGRERASEAGGEEGGSVAAARDGCRFPCKALSVQNEVSALTKAMDCFVQARDAFPTTLDHDEARNSSIHTIKCSDFLSVFNTKP